MHMVESGETPLEGAGGEDSVPVAAATQTGAAQDSVTSDPNDPFGGFEPYGSDLLIKGSNPSGAQRDQDHREG